MKILFLGTSAAEWYPAPWCNCENCSVARARGGRDIRHYSCILIDDEVLVDIPPDIHFSTLRLGINLTKIKIVLVSHPHDDHFYPRIFIMRRAPTYINGELTGPRMSDIDEITVAGSEPTIRLLKESLSIPLEELKVKTMILRPYIWYSMLNGNLRILPLPAHHMVGTNAAFIYVIEKNSKRILYAVDTGIPRSDVLNSLKGLSLDAVICEATLGLGKLPENAQHMNVELAKKFREILIKLGCIDKFTPYILTHVSPHWMPPHHMISDKLRKEGLILAYDGFLIKI